VIKKEEAGIKGEKGRKREATRVPDTRWELERGGRFLCGKKTREIKGEDIHFKQVADVKNDGTSGF